MPVFQAQRRGMVERRRTSCRYSSPLLQNREEEAEEAADDALVTSGGLHATLDTHHQTQPVLVHWMARQGGRAVRLESRQSVWGGGGICSRRSSRRRRVVMSWRCRVRPGDGTMPSSEKSQL